MKLTEFYENSIEQRKKNFYERAKTLIGKPRIDDRYECNHLVNEVLTGNKQIGSNGEYMFAVNYKTWGGGIHVGYPEAGVVVYGKGQGDSGNTFDHVVVFIDNEYFLHTSSRKKQVVLWHKSYLGRVFPESANPKGLTYIKDPLLFHKITPFFFKQSEQKLSTRQLEN